jgi:two-component SAPR family response regulator
MRSKPNMVFILGNNNLISFILNYKLSPVNKIELVSFNSADEALQQMNLKPDIIVIDKKNFGFNSTSFLLKQLRAIAPKVSVIFLYDKGEEFFFKELKINYDCQCLMRENESSKMADRLIQVIQNSIKTQHQSKLFFYLSLFILCTCVIAAYTLVSLFNT